ncbi:DUF4912 domain-containing protein [Moorella thermoacetica]|uniref:DUF4912 domain-containing protein n=1 Tax=Moorella thermoacetica (strain ATCC 39073 / JCM 9320) TaxID=264732 RepID=Q2RHD4_MOOTA|nr:DUF4912 domain-containing protein [Moorella thermoacetica]MDN5326488.1 hypothetical protein [Moorella sp. (in: firmicutes)]AKX94669.1 hypothetical protein MOTHE_c18850 [Moorella thermoacetica]AKX97302.1 hypothetical protein MOTHA_c19650 [Moorella thermoacetica]OIQ12412.1 hypothetical protein MOOTH_07410 [Moorella thermoacetica]OIQ57279.1 hypothetical protein MOCA_08600 [Moorella thermoacetica]
MLDLAHGYHQNALICLPQDLHTLYVYWDFTPARIRILVDFFHHVRPEMELTLRLCRQDCPLPEQQLTLESLEPGWRYFSNLDDRAAYHLELGAQSPEGEFVLFSRTPVFQIQPGRTVEPAGARQLPPGLNPDWTIPPEGQQSGSNFSWS